ncbi:pentatricopeptide repeat-containing protein At4g39530 [Olea europaea var. sylvestris]|nr:pentatricopeptide repeat-containing protein At4g39530 [Olea europaea var. sylvestris]
MRNFLFTLQLHIKSQAKTTEQSLLKSLSKLSSHFLHSESHGVTTTTHNRQTHRQYLGKLLLSPTQTSNNSIVYYKTVHAQIILCGFENNVFLSNVLISLYSKWESILSARCLFDRMPERNLVTWSSMISVYTQNGHSEDSLILFREYRKTCKESSNEYVLASVFRSCTELGSVENGTCLHSFIIKVGSDNNAYLGTCLIDFYSKTSDMESARLVFDDMKLKNVVTWTVILTGFAKSGRGDISLNLFRHMVETEVVPDRYMISSVLVACSMLEFLEGGKQVHAYVLRRGGDMDASLGNVIMDFYIKCGDVKNGRKVFHQIVVKDVFSWTTMIFGYMQSGLDLEAMKLLTDMNSLGWKPDGFACSSVLTSCGSVGALEQGREIHAYTMKTNLDTDEYVKNSLIDLYSKSDCLIDAERVFHDSENDSVVSYIAMIEGYSRKGNSYKALGIFTEMRLNSIPPSLLTFFSLLGMSSSQIALGVCTQLHSLVIKFGFCFDISVGSSLIDVYSKCSSVKDARHLFEEIGDKDIVVWNSMLFGYASQSKNEEALRLYLELQHSVQRPNEFTLLAMLMACSNLACLLHGLQFHNQAIKLGLDSGPFVTNALVDMYAKCGSIEAARKVFNSIVHKDIVCWNSIISMYAQHGDAKTALEIFEEMKNAGMRPNYVSFVGVLSACSNVGLLDEGFNYFESMSRYGIEPGIEHYTCMVSLFGRAGKLYEAKAFIEKMPIQPAAIVWKSFLGPCQVTGNLELAEHAAEMAISIDPKDSGSYTLLSNLFASKGMWIDVKKVREKMEKNGVVKEIGCSWIELNNEVHLFFSRDRTHRDTDLIYALIGRLIKHMKGMSYEPPMLCD